MFGQDEVLTFGRQQLGVGVCFIEDLQCGGIVDGRDLGDVLQLGSIHKAQCHQCHGGDGGADDDEGGASAEAGIDLVGQGAEQRQQEQRQNVVDGHNDTGPALGHTELVGQQQGDGAVVCLPEQADEEKCEAHQQCAFVIEFHNVTFFCEMVIL